MSKLSDVNLNDFSEQELQKLIHQSKKQIKKLKTKKVAVVNSKDPDVIAVANALRELAKSKKVPPAEALSAVAKNLRIAMTPNRKSRSETPVKYRHPEDENKTWKGFGKRPLWLAEALQKGHKLEEFKV
ncbi:DNA-binding protein H-NS [Methylophaga frappieri]|uniref:DNA-binding protein H-NS n=1 Tax=Methylophaga frappieri (strain ATCC BAA-2434 / DSM 25690 / JAM7) TaxID=754477 RepID=I1YFS9_METFJ|nr:H-NS histone family protein [Methylophaga frappieri]AFJ01772.1 DNA-binding protein H-NS [Methylophaga frappieri]